MHDSILFIYISSTRRIFLGSQFFCYQFLFNYANDASSSLYDDDLSLSDSVEFEVCKVMKNHSRKKKLPTNCGGEQTSFKQTNEKSLVVCFSLEKQKKNETKMKINDVIVVQRKKNPSFIHPYNDWISKSF